jgi:N-acetylglucosamine malate deacetylase 1
MTQKILAIGAHCDDIELGCGGTLARHVTRGDSVTCLILTRSGYRNPKGELVRADETAEAEARAASKVLGGEGLRFARFSTFEQEFTEALKCIGTSI